jgi:hypothetical protein
MERFLDIQILSEYSILVLATKLMTEFVHVFYAYLTLYRQTMLNT